jgi:FkbM family methyltransferase
MKTGLIYCLSVAARIYLRWMPGRIGKSIVWNRIVRPYILWRNLPATARPDFGAKMEGELGDIIHNHLYFFGVWEPGVTRVYRLHLRPGDVCIDIGANVGAHALLAASIVGNAGQVHAVEASPAIFRRLLRNLALSAARQVRPYNVAVTDAAMPVTIFLHDSSNLGGTTIMPSEANCRPTTREVVIEGNSLPNIVPIDHIRAARLIKIDGEGAEWLVLTGMQDVLSQLRDDCLVLLEVSSNALADQGKSIDDVLSLMQAHGFEPFQISNPYDPKFYFRSPGRVLSSVIRKDAPLLDLGFARAATHHALLQADRA